MHTAPQKLTVVIITIIIITIIIIIIIITIIIIIIIITIIIIIIIIINQMSYWLLTCHINKLLVVIAVGILDMLPWRCHVKHIHFIHLTRSVALIYSSLIITWAHYDIITSKSDAIITSPSVIGRGAPAGWSISCGSSFRLGRRTATGRFVRPEVIINNGNSNNL